MQNTEKVNRIGLSFRKDNLKQSDAYRFLSGCGRQKTDVVTLAVAEFVQKYGLSDSVNPDSIREFLTSYGYIRHTAAPQDGDDAPAAVEDAVPDERISAKNRMAEDRVKSSPTQGLDMEQGASALAAFGI